MTDRTAPADHSIPPLLASRWSPRAYEDRAPDDATLARVLEGARWAASCFNDQPWSFLVTRRGGDGHAAMLGCLGAFNQAWAGRAPVLIISFARKSFAHNGEPNRHAWYDVGQATANMALAAAAEGMQLHQMAGFDAAAARTAFQVPDTHDAVAAITMGWAGDPAILSESQAAKEVAPRTRHAIGAFTHLGAWGGTGRV
ncbi:nitroreductase family protein [Humitalea sp. 24SJ18S-53]|uniref:nitroreductase family protein n=1 Tax=Humitalea sp. 24SJ18S-53 TaxID=3422307 RepID=UPI003D66705C